MSTEVVHGPDGLVRCPWSLSAPEYVAYHDTEWGWPVDSVAGLYERLTLEAFQSGLAWITILRKREGFRAAFAGFDPEVVAGFGEDDRVRLLADAGIVRNVAKVDAAIANARVVAVLGERFVDLVWSFRTPSPRPRPGELRAVTPESTALAKALKAEGIRFVGPTTAYALMQATGLVDDHRSDCEVPDRDALRAAVDAAAARRAPEPHRTG
ncbi:DNA-3-methyladenine glycosylase I [Microlunatus sagamiharensis]|uniref:DNA-3-methyladenine glycosylase I n=1 Tax=Microlunatus sagamiharensis TaxID=546874 RepID=A0A1H2MTF2_9ACTN|nr:DNA-3-methyladenine glycosylase I [Microlunatus sagamiharensis]SDU96509.1 DNA-3-methyladenine glycosylase I [Microlunatus sagamiharensis]